MGFGNGSTHFRALDNLIQIRYFKRKNISSKFSWNVAKMHGLGSNLYKLLVISMKLKLEISILKIIIIYLTNNFCSTESRSVSPHDDPSVFVRTNAMPGKLSVFCFAKRAKFDRKNGKCTNFDRNLIEKLKKTSKLWCACARRDTTRGSR